MNKSNLQNLLKTTKRHGIKKPFVLVKKITLKSFGIYYLKKLKLLRDVAFKNLFHFQIGHRTKITRRI